MDNEIEKLIHFEKCKKRNDEYRQEARVIVNEALKNRDYSRLIKMSAWVDDESFIMTGEIWKIWIMMLVYTEEKSMDISPMYFDDVNTYEELFEKYTYTVLMLRRIEVAPYEEYSDEAYKFILNSNISPQALVAIVGKERYEKKKAIMYSILNHLDDYLDDERKLGWYLCLANEYSDNQLYLNAASIYLDYGLTDSALSVLKKINKPDDDILDIIKMLENR